MPRNVESRHPITVVIVDDDDDARGLLRVNLDVDGRFNVMTDVDTGEAGLNSALLCKPDVLVLDLMMPGMNGAQVLQEIRDKCPETKVVMWTAATIGVASSLTGDRADLYVAKTEVITDVVDKIAALGSTQPSRLGNGHGRLNGSVPPAPPAR